LAAGHVLRETSARELVEVYQVHGDACLTVYPHQPAHGPQSTTTKADAILTSDPARVLAIRTADCVPVLIATSDGRHVAAIHAGWRGVVAGIVPKVAAAVRAAALHDGRSTVSLLVAIGPCISAAQFEVGPEVVTEFRRVFGDQAPVLAGGIAESSPADRSRIDLVAAIVLQLTSAGLASPADISTSPHCTFADSNLFFSHRRDRGLTGRMASIIAPRGR